MTTTAGIFTTHTDAEKALAELKAFGIAEADLSYVYIDTKGEIHDTTAEAKVDSGTAAGITTGAVVGAIAGIVVATGVLPGLGALVVGGPLATLLGFTGATATIGATAGAAAGGLLGALGSLGISDQDVAIYEAMLRKGDILVVAHTPALGARDIFVRMGATEVREYPSV